MSNAKTRTFVDAKEPHRCQASITLRDGSGAQCGRRKRPDSSFCTQHARLWKKGRAL